jgi:hypothetical protein
MASQYFNPFEAIKPSPYVPMFNMELAMKAGEMAKEREDQGIEMESALQEMFGNIRPTTGDTTKRYVDELQSKYDAQIKGLASKVGSYADPDNLRAIRKLVTNFRSNPNLKHIVEFEALKKADALENAKLRKEGKLVQIDFTRDDALVYNPETNQYEPSEFQSGMEVKQDWQKPLIETVKRAMADIEITGLNAATLSSQMMSSSLPLIDKTTNQITGYYTKASKEKVNDAFNLYMNDPAVQQRVKAMKFENPERTMDNIEEELKSEFIQEAKIQGSSKTTQDVMTNILFDKDGGKDPNAGRNNKWIVRNYTSATNQDRLDQEGKEEIISTVDYDSKVIESFEKVNDFVSGNSTIRNPEISETYNFLLEIIKKESLDNKNIDRYFEDTPNFTKYWIALKGIGAGYLAQFSPKFIQAREEYITLIRSNEQLNKINNKISELRSENSDKSRNEILELEKERENISNSIWKETLEKSGAVNEKFFKAKNITEALKTMEGFDEKDFKEFKALAKNYLQNRKTVAEEYLKRGDFGIQAIALNPYTEDFSKYQTALKYFMSGLLPENFKLNQNLDGDERPENVQEIFRDGNKVYFRFSTNKGRVVDGDIVDTAVKNNVLDTYDHPTLHIANNYSYLKSVSTDGTKFIATNGAEEAIPEGYKINKKIVKGKTFYNLQRKDGETWVNMPVVYQSDFGEPGTIMNVPKKELMFIKFTLDNLTRQDG